VKYPENAHFSPMIAGVRTLDTRAFYVVGGKATPGVEVSLSVLMLTYRTQLTTHTYRWWRRRATRRSW
jgi:hypothetical protein